MGKNINQMSDEIAQSMREIFEATENNMMMTVSSQLNKNTYVNDYYKKQLASKKALKKELEDKAQKSVDMLLFGTTATSKIANIDTKKLDEAIEKTTKALVNSALEYHGQALKKVTKLEDTVSLKESIFKQTQIGIDKGLKVQTKNGRMGYKEYMEMQVRTTVSTEISAKQLDAGKNAKVVFYIVNEFQDCADDHADYQGKVYYDERFESFGFNDEAIKRIKSSIKARKMLSVQYVRSGKPYLTTRPNCRHTFTALSLDQVFDNTDKQIIRDLGLSTGTYKDKNYEAMQSQRANERAIRAYKARAEMNKKLYEQTKDKAYLIQSQKDNVLMRKWQERQRQLIKSNPHLERDYRRETRKILVQDLGAKYNNSEYVEAIEPMIEKQVMPEAEQKYFKTTYKVDYEPMPKMWDRKGFKKTYESLTDWFKENDAEYADDELRTKISSLYRNQEKLFPDLKLVKATGKNEFYNPTYQQVHIHHMESSIDTTYRHLEIVTHELGHAFDNGIARKIGMGYYSISEADRTVLYQIKNITATAKKMRMSKQDIDAYVKTNITDKFDNMIKQMTPEQKEIYKAGSKYSNEIQNAIKLGGKEALKSETYQKVKQFDIDRKSIASNVNEETGITKFVEEKNRFANGIRLFDYSVNGVDMPEDEQNKVKEFMKEHKIKEVNNEELWKLKDKLEEMQNEYYDLRNKVAVKIKQAKEDFDKKNIHIGQMSDFIDALTLGQARDNGYLGYGHGSKYYRSNTGQPEVEIFTHLTTLNMLAPKDYAIVKKDYPEICGAYEDIITKSIDYLEKEVK